MKAVLVLEINGDRVEESLRAIMAALNNVNDDDEFIFAAHAGIDDFAEAVLNVFYEATDNGPDDRPVLESSGT